MGEYDARAGELHAWLTSGLGMPVDRLTLASADASFRRYFRAHANGRSWVVMDAPPGHEDVRPYLKVSRLLEATGVHVPHVHESDIDQGFVLLEDLGSTAYLAPLARGEDVDRLYGEALEALAAIQVRGREAARELPPYDERALTRELELMPEWFCARHLRLQLGDDELALLVRTFDFLVREALAQVDVEAGERLVEQQQARRRRQRACQRHALLLAAREFVRSARRGARQPDEFEHALHAPAPFGARQAGQAEGDVVAHVQVRKQRVVLEHHADAPQLGRAVRAAGRPREHLVLDRDTPGRDRLEPRDGAQQRSLAAARRTDQRADLAARKAERHALDRAAPGGGTWVADRSVLDGKEHGPAIIR